MQDSECIYATDDLQDVTTYIVSLSEILDCKFSTTWVTSFINYYRRVRTRSSVTLYQSKVCIWIVRR